MKRLMKKVTTCLLGAAIAAVILAGCGTSEKTDNPNADVKVALLLEGSLGDESINDQAYEGLKLVGDKFGVTTKYVECTDSSTYVDTLRSLSENGYSLIVCDAFNFADALREVAPYYPDVNFAIFDSAIEDIDNVTSFMYASHESSFLAGVAAAITSESGIIGFIGGMEIPGIVRFQVGFEEGVHYVNPEAKVITKYIGNDNSAWSDPATAKSLAIDCINNGADVCYHAAGGSGIGMIEACTEKDVWAIGVNVDQAHLSPDRVLTSALTKGDQAIYLFTESYLNGSILKGLYDLDCSNDGVGLVDSEHLSEEAKEAVQQAKEKISNGEIKVTKYE